MFPEYFTLLYIFKLKARDEIVLIHARLELLTQVVTVTKSVTRAGARWTLFTVYCVRPADACHFHLYVHVYCITAVIATYRERLLTLHYPYR